MKIYKNLQDFVACSAIAAVLLACVVHVGCSKPVSSSDTADKKLPKIYLHTPKKFEPAVERLRELYDSITSSDPLPESIICRVLESIHGTGAAAHSHFHLADGGPGAHHHEGESSEKIHEIPIDVFTELRDIAKVLPKRASASELEEEAWSAVKKASGEIVDLMDGSIAEAATMEEKRTVFTSNKDTFDRLLVQIETVTPADADSASNTTGEQP